MTVYDFIQKINGGADIEDVITTKTYLPILQKKDLAHKILAKSTVYYDGMTHIDYTMKDVCLKMEIMRAYTDIEVAKDKEKMIEEYDALMAAGLLSNISFQYMNESEYHAVCNVLDNVVTELKENKTLEASVAKLADSIDQNMSELVEAIVEKIKVLELDALLPEDMNLTDVLKMLVK